MDLSGDVEAIKALTDVDLVKVMGSHDEDCPCLHCDVWRDRRAVDRAKNALQIDYRDANTIVAFDPLMGSTFVVARLRGDVYFCAFCNKQRTTLGQLYAHVQFCPMIGR